MPFPSSRDQTQVSCIASRCFFTEPQVATKPIGKSSKLEAASIFRLLVFKERRWGEIWKGKQMMLLSMLRWPMNFCPSLLLDKKSCCGKLVWLPPHVGSPLGAIVPPGALKVSCSYQPTNSRWISPVLSPEGFLCFVHCSRLRAKMIVVYSFSFLFFSISGERSGRIGKKYKHP